MPVANDQPPPLLITSIGVLSEEVLHFGVNGRLQHPAGSIADQLIERTAAVEVRSKRQHLRVDRLARHWCCVQSLSYSVLMAYPCAHVGPLKRRHLNRIRRLSSLTRTQLSTISRRGALGPYIAEKHERICDTFWPEFRCLLRKSILSQFSPSVSKNAAANDR